MTARQIIAEMAAAYGTTVPRLMERRPGKRLVIIRWKTWDRLQRELHMSLKAIGREFGGLDHTTVMYGLREHALLVAPAARQFVAEGGGL